MGLPRGFPSSSTRAGVVGCFGGVLCDAWRPQGPEPNRLECRSSSKSPLEDAVAHIVDLDVAQYFALTYLLESTRDAYIAVGDALEKNKEKITKPKGEGGNAMSMF